MWPSGIKELEGKDLAGFSLQLGYVIEGRVPSVLQGREPERTSAVLAKTGERFVRFSNDGSRGTKWMAKEMTRPGDSAEVVTLLFLLNTREGYAIPIAGSGDTPIRVLTDEEFSDLVNKDNVKDLVTWAACCPACRK